MINVDIVIGMDEVEEDLGSFEFVTLPRVGEKLTLRHDDKREMLTVEEVFHYPKVHEARAALTAPQSSFAPPAGRGLMMDRPE
jgi:hypothetical protein